MKITKPQDTAAQTIEFGVEIETMIPDGCGIDVGSYHHGLSVRNGTKPDGTLTPAPYFRGVPWKAERDGSIRVEPGYKPCEFVSPILKGDEGLAALRAFINFANAIGAKVNSSCGCHITVSIKSIIGTREADKVAEFVRKLAHVAQHHAWAIYAQTGTDRHLNNYSHQLRLETERIVAEMIRTTDTIRLSSLAAQCGRGMVNFNKAFTVGAIEFRAFASTLNERKIMHHLATALGLMRRAATVKTFGRFDRKSTKKHSRVANAVEALRRLWRVLGWSDSVPGRDCALGLFGALHAEFGTYRQTALEMAEQFERRFPAANL